MSADLKHDSPLPAVLAREAPGFSRSALFLDMDGTLLDIAATPASVVVAPGLLDDLRQIRTRLGGALAVVTGRPIEQVDALLQDAPHAVSGEHGGAVRLAPGAGIEQSHLPSLPPGVLDAATAIADATPGVLLEPKSRGFVLHFRAVPEAGPALHAALADLTAPHDATLVLLAAHMAWEVKPRGADKGTAVRTLMQHPPFRGRLPVFIGDDVTDQDGMAACRDAGGFGLFVPDVFGDAAGVRRWLARLARSEGDLWPAS